MSKINRRSFIKGSGLVTLAGMGGVQLGFANSLIRGGSTSGKDLLVYVFLNGGMDGLNMVPPRSGADYNEYISNALRPNLHIPSSLSIALNGSAFGMHPSAPEMASLFNQNKMAIIHATGLVESNRSHFEATAMMEQGVQGQAFNGTGWLTRYFNSSLATPDDAVIPSFVPSYNNTDAVLGDPAALVMGNPSEFSLDNGFWGWEDEAQMVLGEINANPDTLEKLVAQQTLNSSTIVQGIDWDNYVPGNGAVYPSSYFGDQLKTVAQLYKENGVDLEVAYVPLGGWDTHVGQGTGTTGDFADLTQTLSQGLNAIYQDLSATHAGRFTIIVQSEFGRQARENNSSPRGTDHGYGNPMFIIGDNVNGGFHGSWPGLQPNQLFEGDALDVTADYRDVVSEVLIKRMQNRFLGHIFPGYTGYTPLGVVNGPEQTPIYEFDFDPLFSNSFD